MGDVDSLQAQTTAPGFVRDLARWGDAPALVFPGDWTLTYAELARRVERRATAPGEGKRLVAIEADGSDHAVVAYLAALMRGHAVAMLPPDAEAGARFEADFGPEIQARRVDARWRQEEIRSGSAGDLHPDLALLLSTSGSTGPSRFVRLSADNLDANAGSIAEILDLTQLDRAALILPLHYAYGLSVLHSHLAVGASLFMPGGSLLDEGVLEAVRRSRCTNIAGVPHSYELLERIGFRGEALPDLRFMTVAGGRLAPAMARRYHDHLAARGARLVLMYGQTEATARMAFVPPERLPGNFDTIGIAIPGGTLDLVDEGGRRIEAVGVEGELVYRGPNVMMGYGASRRDLGRGKEVHDLRTGDAAVRDPSGLFRITGRMRRMSKIAGRRIAHDGLEFALAERGIDAAVVGDDRLLLAAFTSNHAQDDVRRALAEASGLLAFDMRAERLDGLPRLASGKVDYERLKLLLDERPVPAEDAVLAAFEEAFFPHRVTTGDSFASLAGDSLRHVQLSLSLQRVFGQPPEGWENRTIGELAARTAGHARVAPTTIGSDLLIRALAILLVVIQHATHWPVPAGAAAMVLLVGYGLARFQYAALLAGDVRRVLRPLAAVLLPYGLIVAGYTLAWDRIPWASVFLVGNFGFADPVDRTMIPFLYWFVEAYVQMLLIWTGLFLSAPVRRLASADPFRFGLTVLAAAVALRFVGPTLWPLGHRQIFTIPWILYLSAFGWCAAFAGTTARKLALVALGAIVFPLMAYFGGNWMGAWVKYPLQLLALALLLFVPRLRLPEPIVRLVLPMSAASFHIYLFHRFVPEHLLPALDRVVPAPLLTALAIIGGVGTGLLAYEVQKRILRALTARSRRARRGRGPLTLEGGSSAIWQTL